MHRAPPWICLVGAMLTLSACTREPTQTPGDHGNEINLATLESPERDAWAKPDAVVAALSLERVDMNVADIGAGSGYFTRRIAARVPKGTVYAVDVDGRFKKFIDENRVAWGTPNIQSRLALYENPLLPVDSLDGVFISNTYAYIGPGEAEKITYFKGVHDSLHSGGWLVIVDFRVDATCAEIEVCPSPGARLSADRVQAQLAQAGFELVRREDFLPHQYMLEFRRK